MQSEISFPKTTLDTIYLNNLEAEMYVWSLKWQKAAFAWNIKDYFVWQSKGGWKSERVFTLPTKGAEDYLFMYHWQNLKTYSVCIYKSNSFTGSANSF